MFILTMTVSLVTTCIQFVSQLTVGACGRNVTLPVEHMKTSDDFKQVKLYSQDVKLKDEQFRAVESVLRGNCIGRVAHWLWQVANVSNYDER